MSNALTTLLWMLIDAKVGSCFTLELAFFKQRFSGGF
jgi:hypothetical protein